MELVQIRLIVSDFATVFRFYRDVLGLTPQQNDERGPYGKLSFPGGGAAIALHQRSDLARAVTLAESEVFADRALIAIKVDDVDQTVAAWSARGAQFLAEPHTQWGRLKVAHLRDPEQNLIELQEWLVSR